MPIQSEPAGARSTLLAELAIKRGYLDRNQLRIAIARQHELARGGIQFSLNHTLLERRFITLEQFKLLAHESGKKSAPLTSQPIHKKKLGHYQVIAPLADKGLCKVLKAEDLQLGRTVVLKVLPASLTSNSEWYERFKREVRVAGKLTHPNIVAAYGAEEINGNPTMVLEYVEGESLKERLEREGNIPEIESWQIARELAKGLSFAAENGVVHRNIKPDNILFSNDGRVKILDMGCAKMLNDASELTLPGTTIGTPFYMSPEQAMGAQDLDARSDIYSLGCTLYHMLTGSVPFMAAHCAQVMHKHISAPRPDPRSILGEISEDSARLVVRIMSIKPEQRPASAAALLAEINSLLERLPDEPAAMRPMRLVVASDAGVPVIAPATALPVEKPQRAGLYDRMLNFIWMVLR